MAVAKSTGWAVIYGDASREDPYSGRLVAVLSGIRVGTGDGPHRDVTVNGVPAEAGAPGLSQQVRSPQLGQTVTWRSGGQDLTVLGRGYAEAEIDTLVALAERVTIRADGTAALTEPLSDILYDGNGDVFVGLSPYILQHPVYTLSYHQTKGTGLLMVSGLQLSTDAFNASRAFLVSSEPHDFKGRHGFVGAAWNQEAGPYIAAWQESDDVVVWVVGIGGSQAKQAVINVANNSGPLTDEQWAASAATSNDCFPQVPEPPPASNPPTLTSLP